MLSDIEKQKIRLEETYRSEVKASLEKKGDNKSFLTTLGNLLNSQFTLWLLGALFVTYGVKFYEDYKAEQTDIKETNEAVSKLDLEIGYRYSQVLLRLYRLSIDTTNRTITGDSESEKAIRATALDIGKSKNDTSVFLYKEYSSWSLLTLLAEEKRLLNHLGKNTDDIFRVIGHVSGLEVFYEVRKIDFTNATAVASAIQDALWLSKWKEGGFYFSEGSKESPFP